MAVNILNDFSYRLLFFMSLKKDQIWDLCFNIQNWKTYINRAVVSTMRIKVSITCSIIRPSLHNINSLMLSGDVQTNPGPSISYQNLCEKVSQPPQNNKFFHLNVQNITNKLSSVTFLLIDVGVKTIFEFSRTRLTQPDGHNLWSIDASQFKCYRCDRSTSIKKINGGGVFNLVPNSLVLRERPDLNTFSRFLFDLLWIEFKTKDQSIIFIKSLGYWPAKKTWWKNTLKNFKKALIY